jgi:hypothetical protein
MKYGLDIPTAGKYADARTLAELAAEAEGAGWDGFFTWDVLFSSNQASIPVVDPWVALAAIAQSGTLGWPTKGGWPHANYPPGSHFSLWFVFHSS